MHRAVLVTAAKAEAACGDHSTSPTLLPRSKESSGAAAGRGPTAAWVGLGWVGWKVEGLV